MKWREYRNMILTKNHSMKWREYPICNRPREKYRIFSSFHIGYSLHFIEWFLVSTILLWTEWVSSSHRGRIKQGSMPTWGVMQPLWMEAVVCNRWGSVCRVNVPQCLTVCVNFRHESSRITVPSVSRQHKHGKLSHQQPRRQNVLWMRELCRTTQMKCWYSDRS